MIRTRLTRWCSLLLSTVLISTSLSIAAPVASAAPSEAYTWKNVNTGAGGGFIPGIIFNEKEKDLIYARTDIGGLYRWNPADSSWIPLLDHVGWTDWGKLGVDALATDPVDPNRVYAAVGMYTNGWDPNHGYILRSTDKGDTWQETQLPFYVGGNMPGRSLGERLAIDPNKNSILYFGARSGNGLWKSTDYGVTWSKVTNFPNVGDYVQDPSYAYTADIMGLAWITFDKSTGTAGNATQTIYVGVADKEESIYRSTDGGATWQAVPGQPAGFVPHHGEISGGNLYVTYNDSSGPYDGAKGDVYKYNLATGVWTNISPVPSTSTDLYFGYGGLAVDRTNPDTIMVSTLNSWWPDANIYRSTDGGATWTSIWSWNGYPNRNLLYTQDISAAPWLDFGSNPQPPEPAIKLGWMIGDLEIDPHNPNRMMYGTGATLYGTNNLLDWGTSTKVKIEVMAKNIEETAVQALISPPSGAPLLSAMYDVSGYRHTDLNTSPTKMFTGPNTTSDIDFAETNPNFMARVGAVKETTTASIAFSYDGGANWYNPNRPSGTLGGGDIAVAADGSQLVWSTSDIGVYYSVGGNSWTASTGVPAGAKVASDRVNKNIFYAFSGGNFYISTNGGASFTQTAATGLPSSGQFKTMPGIEGDIWLAGGSDTTVYGLWHSTNGGTSFTKLSNVQEADTIGFGKAATGQTYMALYTSAKIDGVRGIYRSDDAGSSWVRINDNDHQYGVTNTAITGDPRVYGRVYLATNGRGILYADPVGTGTVNNSSITPTSASFDKNTANQADIAVTMTLNGNTLSGIKNGSTSLVSGTDYTVSGTAVTIKKSYLAAQTVGTTNLTFDFSAGVDPVLAISVVDTTVALPGALTLAGTAGNAQASLSWTASTGATSYKVQRATTSTGTYTDLASNLTALSYVDTTAANGTSYYYRVVATNTAGSTTSNTVSVTPAAPVSVPGAFTLTGTAGNAQASLSWTASSGAATYNVERATGSGSYTALATGLTVLTYTDTTAANGTTYNYRIVAVNTAGTTNSNAVSLTPAAPASVPGAFTLTGTAGNAQASLSWTASTGAATYNVERATGSGSYTALATGLTGLTYTDTTAANGTLYNYRIVAVNTVGTTNSNVVSLTPTAPATTSGLVVQYKTSNNNATDNQIYATFNIKNTGTSAVSLSNLKLRYYLTKDTTSATLNYWVDYAQVGGSNITGAFTTLSPAKTNADTYLELSFSSAAGSIAAGGQSGEIQVRIAKSDWSNFNEANDHSFDGTKTAFADWNKVTLYQSGTLVWGVEPQ